MLIGWVLTFVAGLWFGLCISTEVVLWMARAYGRGERWGAGHERVAALFRGDPNAK